MQGPTSENWQFVAPPGTTADAESFRTSFEGAAAKYELLTASPSQWSDAEHAVAQDFESTIERLTTLPREDIETARVTYTQLAASEVPIARRWAASLLGNLLMHDVPAGLQLC